MDEKDPMRVHRMHADICKTFVNPWRLRIVEVLGGRESSVTDLARTVGAAKANVSQHLAVMRGKGVVECRWEGNRCFYRLASPKILRACRLMREVLIERIEERGVLARSLRSAERPAPRAGRNP